MPERYSARRGEPRQFARREAQTWRSLTRIMVSKWAYPGRRGTGRSTCFSMSPLSDGNGSAAARVRRYARTSNNDCGSHLRAPASLWWRTVTRSSGTHIASSRCTKNDVDCQRRRDGADVPVRLQARVTEKGPGRHARSIRERQTPKPTATKTGGVGPRCDRNSVASLSRCRLLPAPLRRRTRSRRGSS
jgi:hypothetical protein